MLRMSCLSGLLMCGLSLALGGCGSELPKPVSVTPGSEPALKTMLEDLANTGELGSGAQQIREEIEKLKATDSAKGTALLADLDKLAATEDPEAKKALAKKMAEKL